jgi:hypothetical protein
MIKERHQAETALRELFAELFDTRELKRWLADHYTNDLVHELPDEIVSRAEMSHAVVGLLSRRAFEAPSGITVPARAVQVSPPNLGDVKSAMQTFVVPLSEFVGLNLSSIKTIVIKFIVTTVEIRTACIISSLEAWK